jgi:hypothetical protein
MRFKRLLNQIRFKTQPPTIGREDLNIGMGTGAFQLEQRDSAMSSSPDESLMAMVEKATLDTVARNVCKSTPGALET